MIALVSRTGRHHQRYDSGSRLVAGCIPYRLRQTGRSYDGNPDAILEVLMVTPHRGKGLLFPKGGWENDETKEEAACREALEEAGVKGEIKHYLGSWDFCSKVHKKDCNMGGARTSYMYALFVTEQLDWWPEKDARQRKWVTIKEAKELCKREWMRHALDALEKSKDYILGSDNYSSESSDEFSSCCTSSPGQSSDEEDSMPNPQRFYIC